MDFIKKLVVCFKTKDQNFVFRFELISRDLTKPELKKKLLALFNFESTPKINVLRRNLKKYLILFCSLEDGNKLLQTLGISLQ